MMVTSFENLTPDVVMPDVVMIQHHFDPLSLSWVFRSLYLKELKVCRPAPRVPRPASLPVPQPQNSLVTSYLFLGRE